MCQTAVDEGVKVAAMKGIWPEWLGEEFDYSTWMGHEAEEPLRGVYYSNGLLAVEELPGLAMQRLITVGNSPVPDTTACRFDLGTAMTKVDVDCPHRSACRNKCLSTEEVFTLYMGDRVAGWMRSGCGLEVRVERYIPWNTMALVHCVQITYRGAEGLSPNGPGHPIRLRLESSVSYAEEAAQDILCATAKPLSCQCDRKRYGGDEHSHPSCVALTTDDPGLRYCRPKAEGWQALGIEVQLMPGEEICRHIVFGLGFSQEEADLEAERVLADPDCMSGKTRDFWNDYYASCPKVVPAEGLSYVNGATGRAHKVSAEEILRSQLWNWRALLSSVCRGSWLKCAPIMIADWGQFIGMWANDGCEEALALSFTNQSELARGAIVNWLTHAVNRGGDGRCAWTLYPSCLASFDNAGQLDETTQGVPFAPRMVAGYVRATGDLSLLDEKLGPAGHGRTLWEQLLAYENGLLDVRDCNGDHLLDWINPYETGWDNKDSPFVEARRPTTAINEQVFRIWSLEALAHLARMRGENPARFEWEAEIVREAVSRLLWSEDTCFYHDLDLASGSLWTSAKNLDAFYWLFYERDPKRVESLVSELGDESAFCGSLLPTLSFDSPRFRTDGYWDGRAWPRVHAYVGVGLARAGHAELGLSWALRAILSNTGPICPETLDPTADPVSSTYEGPCTLMGYNALVCLALLDICGLEMWTGGDLDAVARDGLPELYIAEHKCGGASFSALFEPGKGLSVYSGGVKICKVSPGQRAQIRAGT